MRSLTCFVRLFTFRYRCGSSLALETSFLAISFDLWRTGNINIFEPRLRIHTAYSKLLTEWQARRVQSPYWRFYWNDREGAFVEVAGKRVELRPESVYLIPPHTLFRGVLRNPVNHFVISFSESMGYVGSSEVVYRFEACEATREAIERASLMHRSKELKTYSFSLEISFLLFSALRQLPEGCFAHSRDDEAVSEAIDYMENHLSESISVADMARSAGLNTNAFIARFRRSTGTTPKSYLIGVRMKEACILLSNTSKSIDEIAEEVGFCNRYHFSAIFRKRFYTPPAAYRKRCKEGG